MTSMLGNLVFFQKDFYHLQFYYIAHSVYLQTSVDVVNFEKQ